MKYTQVTHWYYYFALGRVRSIATFLSVCLSLCLSDRPLTYLKINMSTLHKYSIVFIVLSMAVARFFFEKM